MILLQGLETRIESLRFSPDGGHLAARAYGGIQVWRDPVRNRQPALVPGVSSAWGVEFLPGGKLLLAAAYDGPSRRRTFLYDLGTGAEDELPLGDAPWQGYWCVPTPDGRHLLVVLESLSPDAWVVSLRTIERPSAPLWSVPSGGSLGAPVFLPDGRFALLGRSRVLLQQTATGEVAADVSLKGEYHDPVASPDGRFLAARRRFDAAVFRVDDLKAPPAVLNYETRQELHGLAFHPSGRYLATAGKGTVKIHDTASWAVARAFAWQIGRLRSLAFSPDGMLGAAGNDRGQILLWDFDL